MNIIHTSEEHAEELDRLDELAGFRSRFIITDDNLIYLDGNSLGRLPIESAQKMQVVVQNEWGHRLIRAWNDGWIAYSMQLGAKIASLIGAKPDEVLVADSTSINLFKLAIAVLQQNPDRRKIVSDSFNFPTDLYILQGVIDLLGKKHTLQLVKSPDGISIPIEAVDKAIDNQTGLVCLTHVAFKSAYMYDMQRITDLAHQAGAFMLWDLSHSTGAVPLDLNACGVDLAVGCTYKYLNGGPGAPAYLYIRRDLQDKLRTPLWGWFAARDKFAFDLEFTPAEGIAGFQAGTPPILSMKAIETGVDLILEAGINRIRNKSVLQSEYLIYLAEQWLYPLGFKPGSPADAAQRGSHVSLQHPEGYRINRALIEAPDGGVKVIPDFRAPNNIRLGIAPLYTRFVDINRAMARIKEILENEIYQRYSTDHLSVT
jgi:kynureninase